MRASTLFGMTIAILIGMAVVFGVKSAGLFDRTLPVKVNNELPKILVAGDNLYEGHATTTSSVMIRAVDPSELDNYIKNRHKFMPAMLQAANNRVLARNVLANEPLLKEHFQDHAIPGSFGELLEPNMRAVNVRIPREHAGGGIIRKNDLVDVYLTTAICADPACSNPISASAPLALGLKVIVKRDNIFTVMARDDETKPMSFTLQANAYRAALIEFAKNRGYLTLVPTGPPKTKKGMQYENDGKDEELRVINIVERGHPITDKDIEEIFKLTAINRPGGGFIQTERWHGIFPHGGHTFPTGSPYSGPNMPNFQTPDGRTSYGYRFLNPAGGLTTEPCPTCPGGKRVVQR